MHINKYKTNELQEDQVYFLADSQYYAVREGHIRKRTYDRPLFEYEDEEGDLVTTGITNKSELFTTREEAEALLVSYLNKKLEALQKQMNKLTRKKENLVKKVTVK